MRPWNPKYSLWWAGMGETRRVKGKAGGIPIAAYSFSLHCLEWVKTQHPGAHCLTLNCHSLLTTGYPSFATRMRRLDTQLSGRYSNQWILLRLLVLKARVKYTLIPAKEKVKNDMTEDRMDEVKRRRMRWGNRMPQSGMELGCTSTGWLTLRLKWKVGGSEVKKGIIWGGSKVNHCGKINHDKMKQGREM